MKTSKQINISKVAREAGVSTQTISRVVNNRPDVAPETRKRVQEVIDRLGYRPSAIARSLIRQRSNTLGVVIGELGQYGPMRRLLGMEEQANQLGYSLHLNLVQQSEYENSEAIIHKLLAWHVDGIIWAIPEISTNRSWLFRQAAMLPVPLVFICEQTLYNEPAVAVDNRAGGYLAIQHLLHEGYHNIGIITGPLTWMAAQQRKLGWQDALSAWQPEQIFEGDWSAASGEYGLYTLLNQFPALDAVFASNDQMALGVMQAASQRGLSVPQTLGIIGFDNIPESAYFCPPLTTIRHRLLDQGKLAVQKLVEMIDYRKEQTVLSPIDTVVLQPELIIRKSSIKDKR